MSKTSTIFAAVVLAAVAAPAHAAGHSWRIGNDAYHIYFDDLDVATPAGRAGALDRVIRASARLCETQPVERDRKACIAETVAQVKTHWIALARRERDDTDRALAVR